MLIIILLLELLSELLLSERMFYRSFRTWQETAIQTSSLCSLRT